MEDRKSKSPVCARPWGMEGTLPTLGKEWGSRAIQLSCHTYMS